MTREEFKAKAAEVIETCNKYGMAMAFTGIRLFHH